MTHVTEPDTAPPDTAPCPEILGNAEIARIAFRQGNLEPLFDHLRAHLIEHPGDSAAMIDLAAILQSYGEAEQAAGLRFRAVELNRTYATVNGDGRGKRLLALVIPGDFMANTPVDFLLAGSDVMLLSHYVDAATDSLADLPPHDAAFLAVAEGPEARALLARLDRLLPGYPGRMVNGLPARIASLTRDGVSRLLAGIAGLTCPPTLRVGRAALAPLAAGAAPGTLHPGLDWPLILRPEGTHAGAGMALIEDAAGLDAALRGGAGDAFYLSRFVDYRNAEGLFAKARVVLIGGRPYPVHYALSSHWIVHYLSADMAANPARRAAEEAWFDSFDMPGGFAARHADALAEMQARLGLDYWGLDCAETADGQLLVFEVETAMIVHDMDDAQTFPYKPPAMRRIFRAFQALVFES